ncbi:Zinc finger C2H2-type [Trinorchestia longiramus]|nr:Zinc finger C2H2-type [Trinorchestia longiramus]
MKIQPHPTADALRTWSHEDLFDSRNSHQSSEAKTTMDAFDPFMMREYQNHNSTLAELKPLEPMDYLNVSPDTSLTHHDALNNSECSPHGQLYRGALISNTFLGYNGTPEPVSTTTSPISSSAVSVKQEESDTFVGADDIDDLASMIGCANSDTSIPTQPMAFNDQIEPSLPEPSLTIDDWLLLDMNKSEIPDNGINSTLSPHSDLSVDSQTPQPSTTSSIHATLDYSTHHHHHIHQHVHQPPIHSPLQALLAAGSVNNNNANSYLQGIAMSEDTYQKAQPILYNKLTQPHKDTLSNLNSSLLKTDPMFSRYTSFQNKDSTPHSTDATSYTVTTTDDILVTKFDPRYMEQTQLGSPDSDLSSTQLGYDYGDFKGKNRSRLNKSTKLAIRTEGTKDKPVHHCTVCNRGFLNKSNIKVHLRTHTGEKPFRCETCNKAFRQKAHLLKHYQIHKRGARD